jgi:dTDP-4-dehydrorhamnose reductase
VRWLVTGSGGMLGLDVVALLRSQGEDVVAARRADLDVTDASAVLDAVRGADVVVNCAAWVDVDGAESNEAAAFDVNATAAGHLARAARAAGARMVQLSTDYVFDGHGRSPYAESATVAPRSAYGRTKAAGEWAVRAECPDHLVVRTAWLYGAGGPCFPKTVLRVVRERGEISVVDDQVGQPTWTVDVARLVLDLVRAGAAPGIYHGTSAGGVSWFQFARAVVTASGGDPGVVSATTSEAFPRPASRPAYSALGSDAVRAARVAPIGAWDERWSAAAPAVLA